MQRLVIALWVSTTLAGVFLLAEFILKFEHVRFLHVPSAVLGMLICAGMLFHACLGIYSCQETMILPMPRSNVIIALKRGIASSACITHLWARPCLHCIQACELSSLHLQVKAFDLQSDVPFSNHKHVPVMNAVVGIICLAILIGRLGRFTRRLISCHKLHRRW